MGGKGYLQVWADVGSEFMDQKFAAAASFLKQIRLKSKNWGCSIDGSRNVKDIPSLLTQWGFPSRDYQ